MKTHELKTHPDPFRAVADGIKHFEIRKDDRAFSVGDILVLREWKPEGEFTGNWCERKVAYLLRDAKFGVPKGFVILSLERLPRTFWCPTCGGKRE